MITLIEDLEMAFDDETNDAYDQCTRIQIDGKGQLQIRQGDSDSSVTTDHNCVILSSRLTQELILKLKGETK